MNFSKKEKTLLISAGCFVLILLVFLAGWFTVQMLDLSKGLEHVIGSDNNQLTHLDTPSKPFGSVIMKKVPPIPKHLSEPVIPKKETLPAEPEQPAVPVEKSDEQQPKEAEPIPVTTQKDIHSATIENSDKPKRVDLFSIQAGAFLMKEHAEERISLLKKLGYKPYIFSASDAKNRYWHTVRIGKYESLEAASEALSLYRKKPVFPAVITHIDSLSAITQ